VRSIPPSLFLIGKYMIESISENNLNRLVTLLGMLRGLKWAYWNFHWTSKGLNFYQNHLLFQRLYSEEIDEQIDTLAEKITTYDSKILLTPVMLDSFQLFVKTYATGIPPYPLWQGPGDSYTYTGERNTLLWVKELYNRGLKMEKQVQIAIDKSYTKLKSSGELSLGMDDYLMSLANKRETVIYLLRQQLR
jgi:hypothetical protein